MITRRKALAAATAAAAALAAPRIGSAQAAARLLRFAPQTDLSNIDPIWSTTVIARNHGLMIYDMLYGLGADFRPRPQMAAGHEVSSDGRRWMIALRPGLKFHDGEPVRARDCIASIARWSKRDVLGQRLGTLLDAMRALGDDRFEIRLKRPWPGLAWALGKPSANMCAIMPERVARTDANQQITEYVGSGPYRFRQDLWRPGGIAVYERHAGYAPREEPVDFLAGGKVVHFDRVEWRIMPDPATAAAALQNNEIDWWETPLADLLPVLRRNRDIAVDLINTAGNLGVMRFNFLHPPFDNPAVRRALLPAIDQRAFMNAAIGTDPELSRLPAGVFTPGSSCRRRGPIAPAPAGDRPSLAADAASGRGRFGLRAVSVRRRRSPPPWRCPSAVRRARSAHNRARRVLGSGCARCPSRPPPAAWRRWHAAAPPRCRSDGTPPPNPRRGANSGSASIPGSRPYPDP